LICDFLTLHGSTQGDIIWTDLGEELAWSATFQLEVFRHHQYVVEPTGADSPSQNAGAERWNQTLAITTLLLLYGSGLPARYWSVAFVHAMCIHNHRVHSITKIMPYEAWFGHRPDLQHMKVFSSCVCVRQSGNCGAKLYHYHFDGIFIGFTATDQNIRYIDVNSGVVKHSHHAVFDEAWYFQPSHPPATQLLYELGL
jgi:hypothetical protein